MAILGYRYAEGSPGRWRTSLNTPRWASVELGAKPTSAPPPVKRLGPTLFMTPLHGSKYGSCCDKQSLVQVHLSSVKTSGCSSWQLWKEIFPILLAQLHDRFGKVQFGALLLLIPLNKDMCLACCLKAQCCVLNYRFCCDWNDEDLTEDTWPQWYMGVYVSTQRNGLGWGRGRLQEENNPQITKQNTRPNLFQRIYNELVYESSATESEPISFILEFRGTSLE